ncbi:DUF433 domain-containing protein [Methylotetracoccus oryzae]|nr:DUF433 domain-containing protein [Methylotetracoccus oryzae]
MSCRERITIEPVKRGGQPCIRGLRISVYDVLEQLAAGLSPEQIIEDFPELEVDDIRAALAFAADPEHRVRIGDPLSFCPFSSRTIQAQLIQCFRSACLGRRASR